MLFAARTCLRGLSCRVSGAAGKGGVSWSRAPLPGAAIHLLHLRTSVRESSVGCSGGPHHFRGESRGGSPSAVSLFYCTDVFSSPELRFLLLNGTRSLKRVLIGSQDAGPSRLQGAHPVVLFQPALWPRCPPRCRALREGRVG